MQIASVDCTAFIALDKRLPTSEDGRLIIIPDESHYLVISIVDGDGRLSSVWCLRLVSLHVPTRVIVGETIKLSCGYDLEDDKLYSIKWYRDDVEFFRYVPRDVPPGQFFPLQGVTVDAKRLVSATAILRSERLSRAVGKRIVWFLRRKPPGLFAP
ncbi:hypothetical protein JTE90_005747 [Oedothorax gibbosus]|uniref:Ig-like domain-containing protein n=1 Tax=Oedothorax gibbosus TaxID=931172 RepID=A0AAV6URZ8_9ARAC|nr:hypothetical protein JTE90_005747 [Oedothorax gibbosus]